VLREQPGGWLDFILVPLERSQDIAETSGTRSFPWRAIVVAERDLDLVESDMVTRLAAPTAPGADFSWVKPGRVVWDYWANWNIEGVDFATGRNTATFKHYVDFAARHGFEYVNVDWLWTDPLDRAASGSSFGVWSARSRRSSRPPWIASGSGAWPGSRSTSSTATTSA
jgi:alpha-glucosidase